MPPGAWASGAIQLRATVTARADGCLRQTRTGKGLMARDQNTYAKRRREMDKKRKAEEKRARRRRKKEEANEAAPEASGVDGPTAEQ